MSDIFVYKEQSKRPFSDNELVVTFYFDHDVDVDDAKKQIDYLVSLADNDDNVQFNTHEFDLFVTAREEEE